MAAEYTTWMASQAEMVGIDEAVRAPSFEVVCGWIAASWKAVSKETMLRSFQCFGLTLELDGTDDGKLHCFKFPDLAYGLHLLSQRRNAEELHLDADPPAPDPQPEDEQNDDEPLDNDILVEPMLDLDIGAQEEL